MRLTCMKLSEIYRLVLVQQRINYYEWLPCNSLFSSTIFCQVILTQLTMGNSRHLVYDTYYYQIANAL